MERVGRIERMEIERGNQHAEPSRPRGRRRPVVAALVPALAIVIGGLGLGCSDDGAGSSSGGSSKQPMSNATPPPKAEIPKALPEEPKAPEVDTRTPEQLVADGRAVYNANCIACHALDPTVDGALGPAVAGSSLELLEARIVRGEYPEGYEPKRPSRVMVPLPHLEPKLPELAAYLQSL